MSIILNLKWSKKRAYETIKSQDNNKIIIPKNITLHFLPPYNPKLNLIERVWLFLKRNYLSF